MNETNEPKTEPSKTSRVLRIVLLAAFGIAAVLIGFLTFNSVRDFVSTWRLTSLPGVAISEATAEPGQVDVVTQPDVPLQAVGGPTPEPWDGAERVNVLVMGLDYNDWRAANEGGGPPKTDSMILFTIDPINRTAGMMSIPRDLWVNIPGYNYGRINTAYALGEAYKEPGGGPALAMKTVEELLGVPINYYAQIDFVAFINFIDEIGGVKIDIPEKITVDPMEVGKKNNVKVLKPGVQTLDGELALAYARTRKTEGADFERSQRQQQVILGIRDQILRFDLLPTLIAKSGILYNQLSAGIHTNMTIDQVVRLAWLAAQVPVEQIKKGVIGPPDQVSFAVSPDGTQQVLKPITDKIRLLRDDIFATGPVSPAAAGLSQNEVLTSEGAKVRVLNGSITAGLAANTADYLKGQGVNVIETGNAQIAPPSTEITFYNGKPYTVKFLVDLMKINDLRIYYVNDPTSPVDITVTLGDDWAANFPAP
jgi:polyisoprenyl-teichoic acid--peptidoglycan teichoic acid transferase